MLDYLLTPSFIEGIPSTGMKSAGQLLILGRGRDKGLLLGLLSPDYKSPDAHMPNMDDENNKPHIVHDGVVVDS